LAINDGQLTLGDRGKMKLDTDPFPIGMVELMDKKVWGHTDQAGTTKGKNVVIFDELATGWSSPTTQRLAWGRRTCCKSWVRG
jgi:hypothetical protein